jgi:hypothetical protein
LVDALAAENAFRDRLSRGASREGDLGSTTSSPTELMGDQIRDLFSYDVR